MNHILLKRDNRIRSMVLLIFISSLIGSFSASGHAKEWRAIVPLHSTRVDVERLLGPSPTGGAYGYDFENERVFFQYQYPDNQCGEKWGQWDVALNTVLGISVYPKKPVAFADLSLDLSKFIKFNSCSPQGYSFFNAEEGITYSTQDSMIGETYYGPTSKDGYLLCSERSKRE